MLASQNTTTGKPGGILMRDERVADSASEAIASTTRSNDMTDDAAGLLAVHEYGICLSSNRPLALECR